MVTTGFFISKLFLNKGQKAAILDRNAQLIQAALKGNLPDVQIALTNGADINATGVSNDLNYGSDIKGVTALMVASWNGHTEVVKLLLDKGADVNVKNQQRQNSPDDGIAEWPYGGRQTPFG